MSRPRRRRPGRTRRRGLLAVGRAIAGGVVLGVAAIFIPKTRADDHWSAVETAVVVDDEVSAASGPGTDPDATPGELPAAA